MSDWVEMISFLERLRDFTRWGSEDDRAHIIGALKSRDEMGESLCSVGIHHRYGHCVEGSMCEICGEVVDR